jgi:hypothetical protein
VFEPEEKHATVHVEPILPVKGIELQAVVPPALRSSTRATRAAAAVEAVAAAGEVQMH